MKHTPYAAFGTVVILVQAETTDNRIVKLGDDGLVTSGWYFYTKGRTNVKVVETGEQLEDRTPGWLNAEHTTANASSTGHLELTFPEETEWLCIPHVHNAGGLPTLKSLVVKPGDTPELPNNSNIFLVRGKLEVNTKIFTGPCQIRVRSGDTTADVIEDAYGLFFS